jgi:hypothetical protein
MNTKQLQKFDQSNHLFASLVAYVKLEKLKFAYKLNHFALKAKIYWAASKAAWIELGENETRRWLRNMSN